MATASPLRVAFVSPFYDEQTVDPVQTLERFPILTELPQALRDRGHQVRFAGLAPVSARHEQAGIRYRWVAPAAPTRLAGRILQRWKPHYGQAYYQPSPGLARTIRSLQPDIIHVFGLTMDLQLATIRGLAPRSAKIVLHYHGGEPATGPVRQRLQSRAIGGADAALFTSLDQADSWIAAGLIEPECVHQLIETSSPFRRLDRDEARRQTAMTGNPVYLSAGRLHPIKDPLTMLRGFAHIASVQHEARLYLYYLTDELLHDARALVHSFPHMRDRVEFRGRAKPDEMEAIYSSADVLLQASQREWSGLAILEAMSCGVIPVVSEIPSFRAMIGDDRYGRLFETGNPRALADAALSIDDMAAMSEAVQQRFVDELSFEAMARDLERIYRSLLSEA